MTRQSRMLCAALIAASPTLVIGAESRIPINGPYTISTPGTYILSQNFTVTSGPAIRITASNVLIDLNGRTLTHTMTTGLTNRVIQIDTENPVTGLEIRNGFISGGVAGIGSFDMFGDFYPVQARIEGVTITGSRTGIDIPAGESLEIVGCRIEANMDGVILAPSPMPAAPRRR